MGTIEVRPSSLAAAIRPHKIPVAEYGAYVRHEEEGILNRARDAGVAMPLFDATQKLDAIVEKAITLAKAHNDLEKDLITVNREIADFDDTTKEIDDLRSNKYADTKLLNEKRKEPSVALRRKRTDANRLRETMEKQNKKFRGIYRQSGKHIPVVDETTSGNTLEDL
jgi:hypothetical protein